MRRTDGYADRQRDRQTDGELILTISLFDVQINIKFYGEINQMRQCRN